MGWHALVGFAFGVVIASLTAPVGVSGAVFLLPVQLSVLNVPSPSVTPTNLLYDVVAMPGALLRFRRVGGLRTGLARLLVGTIPGVAVGAAIRVHLLPSGTLFRVLVAMFFLPLGIGLLARDQRPGLRWTPATYGVLAIAAARAPRPTGWHVTAYLIEVTST